MLVCVGYIDEHVLFASVSLLIVILFRIFTDGLTQASMMFMFANLISKLITVKHLVVSQVVIAQISPLNYF